MSDLRAAITNQGPQILEVNRSTSDDDEAIHLTSHRIELLDPTDGSVVAFVDGVTIDDGDDDGMGFEYEGRWVCWAHQADIHDGDLYWAAEEAGEQCAGEDRFIDVGVFAYVERVEVVESYRGLGLGQWVAAKFLEAVRSGTDEEVLFTVTAGWPADGAQHHAPAELAAVNQIVAGLPVEQVGDPTNRFHVGAPNPDEIEAAIAAAASRITGSAAA